MGQSFAKILRSLREERGLSQQELADMLNVKRSTIGNYEQGTRSPDMETLELIADFFNVDMDFLYGKTKIKNRYLNMTSGCNTNIVRESPTPYGSTKHVPETIAAHFKGQDFSEDELKDIARFIDFVASKKGDSQ